MNAKQLRLAGLVCVTALAFIVISSAQGQQSGAPAKPPRRPHPNIIMGCTTPTPDGKHCSACTYDTQSQGPIQIPIGTTVTFICNSPPPGSSLDVAINNGSVTTLQGDTFAGVSIILYYYVQGQQIEGCQYDESAPVPFTWDRYPVNSGSSYATFGIFTSAAVNDSPYYPGQTSPGGGASINGQITITALARSEHRPMRVACPALKRKGH
jgi:hypothetical protein